MGEVRKPLRHSEWFRRSECSDNLLSLYCILFYLDVSTILKRSEEAIGRRRTSVADVHICTPRLP